MEIAEDPITEEIKETKKISMFNNKEKYRNISLGEY